MIKMKRSIFRDRALKEYMHLHEKETPPLVIKPPKLIMLWILLGILLLIGCWLIILLQTI